MEVQAADIMMKVDQADQANRADRTDLVMELLLWRRVSVGQDDRVERVAVDNGEMEVVVDNGGMVDSGGMGVAVRDERCRVIQEGGRRNMIQDTGMV